MDIRDGKNDNLIFYTRRIVSGPEGTCEVVKGRKIFFQWKALIL